MMRLLHYIEIENFKTFGEMQRVELDHPAVIIGPNNSGKTSIIQAISLWSQAVKTWYEERRDSKAKLRVSTPLNRLNIVSVPVQRTRFFWHDAKVRIGQKDNIPLKISVGVEFEGRSHPFSLQFRNQGDDQVYFTLDDGLRNNSPLIRHAAEINVNLLYSMSGLEIEEPVLQPGRIGVLLGQGQTAQVLRNLCLQVHNSSPDDWKEISKLIKRLFQVELSPPRQNNRGAIDLSYRQPGVQRPLDISAAGRGFQQILLVFSYLFSHKKSVLLIDEPDAHLEILRQKQIFVLLRDIASLNGSQVIMATHSEVILDETLDSNLTLLLDGRSDNLAKKTDIRQSLKSFGAEHYLRARTRGYILYIEGGTDVSILKALAKKLNHPAIESWDERINTYYVENNYPEPSAECELERVEGGFGLTPKEHFNGIRKLLPGIKGLAILDNDGRGRNDFTEEDDSLRIRYWKRYEVENYFITPSLLRRYCEGKRNELGLFGPDAQVVNQALDDVMLDKIFEKNAEDFKTWKESSGKPARLIWDSKTQAVKLSSIAEDFFNELAKRTEMSILMTKGEFHLLVDLVAPEDISHEVVEKLDLLKELFDHARAFEAGSSAGSE